MLLLKKRTKRDFIDVVTRRSSVVHINDKKQGLDFLVDFFSAIRPSSEKGKDNASVNMDAIISDLYKHPVLLSNLQNAFLSQLVNTDLSAAFTESGIPLSRGFWQEFFGRFKHKMLPAIQSENDFLYVINRVFFRKNDYQWVESISHEQWIRFFEGVHISFHVDDRRLIHHLLQSLKILAFQVTQLGLEREVVNYVPPDKQEFSPFIQLNYLIHELEKSLLTYEPAPVIAGISSKLELVLASCFESIDYIRENHSYRGVSLHQTYTLVMLATKLDRIIILAEVLNAEAHFQTGKFVGFFKMLIRNENRKNSIREFLSQCLGYVAYQIAEHKGSKGNKYITSSRSEYRAMMGSAMNGGLIVCFIVLIKNFITQVAMLPLWHGFFYSVNYSAGFVLIEETHSTLATKQPAFTANAVASSLDTKKNTLRPNLYNLALTVAKTSRSQIASFIGNLIVVFPGTYLLAWLYHLVFKKKLVEGAEAVNLLVSQHPWQSPSLLYACNAGFFLFLSGVIAGSIQNRIQYSQIGERLQIHPLLRLSMSAERLRRLASYIEKHAGAIVGNVALGFMLGMSGMIPKLLGIPFDIRHITISAGNVSLAVYGLGIRNIDPLYLLTVFFGVLGIGFFNFLVSFSFAFSLAVKSRGVRLKDYPEFLGILWRYFRKKPLDFIRPGKASGIPAN